MSPATAGVYLEREHDSHHVLVDLLGHGVWRGSDGEDDVVQAEEGQEDEGRTNGSTVRDKKNQTDKNIIPFRPFPLKVDRAG